MTLTLLAVSLNDQPLSQPITAHFDGRGGTVGRADHNTMALPDPERHISRLQAEVVASGERFIIRNVGAANPITVAGRTLGHNEMAALNHGDEIRIGGYLLQVDASPREAALDVTRGRAMLGNPLGGIGPGTITGMKPLPRTTQTGGGLSSNGAGSPGGLATTGSGAGGGIGSSAGGSFAGFGITGGTQPGNPFADLLGPAPAAAPAALPGAALPVSALPAAAPAATADPFAELFGVPGTAARADSIAPAPAPLWPNPSPAVTPAPLPAPPAPKSPAAADPFASLLPPPAGVPAASPAVARAPAGPSSSAKLPENFDPFASLPSASPPPEPASAATDPFAALMPAGPAPSIDAMFGLGSATPGSADPLAQFMAGAPVAAPAPGAAHKPIAAGPSADPIEALFGGAPPAPASAPVQSDHVPALHAAFAPPRMLAPAVQPAPALSPPVSPPAPAPVAEAASFVLPIAPAEPARAALPPVAPLPPAPSFAPAPPPAPALAPERPAPRSAAPATPTADSADAARLWAALCEGAGIHLPMPAIGTEAQMRDIGRILRSAVDGTLRLMAVRTSTRHEMRASVTIIQARNNNPLKFSPDAQAALEALLQPSLRGFLEGPAAMEDAMQDLVGHSIGSVAGMRAALEGVLDRFAPEQLESRLSSKSVLDAVLTGPRKARLWDLYLQHQRTIRDDAQEDFHNLFGKAFLAAYEQQVAQLKRNARSQSQASAPAAPPGPGP